MPATNEILPAAQAETFTIGGDLTVYRGLAPCALPARESGARPGSRLPLPLFAAPSELGVNLIDTADSYGPNISEELIAEALYPHPCRSRSHHQWLGAPRARLWQHNASPAHSSRPSPEIARLRLSAFTSTNSTFPTPPRPSTPPWNPSRGSKSRARFVTHSPTLPLSTSSAPRKSSPSSQCRTAQQPGQRNDGSRCAAIGCNSFNYFIGLPRLGHGPPGKEANAVSFAVVEHKSHSRSEKL